MCLESKTKSSFPSSVKPCLEAQLEFYPNFRVKVEHDTPQTLIERLTNTNLRLITIFFYDCDVCRFSCAGGLISEMAIEKRNEHKHLRQD